MQLIDFEGRKLDETTTHIFKIHVEKHSTLNQLGNINLELWQIQRILMKFCGHILSTSYEKTDFRKQWYQLILAGWYDRIRKLAVKLKAIRYVLTGKGERYVQGIRKREAITTSNTGTNKGTTTTRWDTSSDKKVDNRKISRHRLKSTKQRGKKVIR